MPSSSINSEDHPNNLIDSIRDESIRHETIVAQYSNRIFKHLIDGKLVSSPDTFEVIDPATARTFAHCPRAKHEQLNQAVSAAQKAFIAWRQKSFIDRGLMLIQLADAVEDRQDEITRLLTCEQGGPFNENKNTVQRFSQILRDITKLSVEDEIRRSDQSGKYEIHYKPLGVVGAITPWNGPVVLAAPKIASALYTGNTIVLKPSPYTPLATLLIGEIAQSIFPRGVLNILAGGNEIGQLMAEHPNIQKINFTGSIATGKRVMLSAASTLKRLTLELGGNDAAILLDDVDIDTALDQLCDIAFRAAGQICMTVKRLYVPRRFYNQVCTKLVDTVGKIKVGSGFEPAVQMGPVQNIMQFNRIKELIEDSRDIKGAEILTGKYKLNRPGYFISPTIVTGLPENARLVQEEQFGPVLPVLEYSDLDKVLNHVNNGKYGLGGSIWTRDVARGRKVAQRLDSGLAWVNRHIGSSPDLPFGGIRESGFGRAYGVEGLKAHMEIQTLTLPPE